VSGFEWAWSEKKLGPIFATIALMKIISGKHLAYYDRAATPEFWDDRWKDLKDTPDLYERFQLPAIIREPVAASVRKGGRILEAGCGMGHIAYGLNRAGWECIGVDFAQKTIETIREIEPDLNVVCADVRHLPFPDETFDAYISIGVIEHFPDGYFEIFQEMDRVLRRHGIVLISFPAMNPLRRFKRSLGLYPASTGTDENDQTLEFYQYALDHRQVVNDLCNIGYTIKRIQWYEAWLGLADETPGATGRLLRRIYNNRNSRVFSALRRSFELLSGLTGYCCQIMAQKNT
jgi:SAM-dependent methyltransferase